MQNNKFICEPIKPFSRNTVVFVMGRRSYIFKRVAGKADHKILHAGKY